MKPGTFISLVAAAAALVGVFYFAGWGTDADAPASADASAGEVSVDPGAGTAAPSKSTTGNVRSVPTADPRLAVFQVSPDNGLTEFIPGADGRVIREVDKNPASWGFGKTLREYSYAGDKVATLTAYDYGGAQVRVTRIQVSYNPDGSVHQFRESTDFLGR